MTPGTATAVKPSPRGSLRLLVDPTVGPYFFGKLLSNAGVWIHNIAAAIVIYELTGSATWVGAASVAQFAPQFFLTPWSGARADRMDRRRQLITGRLITAAGSGGLTVWTLIVGLSGTAGAVALIVAAFVTGTGFALGGPAMQALLPSMVRRSELAAAVTLNSVPFTIARSAGPAAGALLVTAGGPAVAFTTAAAGQLVFALILSRLRIRDDQRIPPKDSSMRAGVRHLRTDPVIAALLGGAAAVSLGADPVITLTPSIAEAMGQPSAFVGALASAFGFGAAGTFVVLGTLRRLLGIPRLASGGLLLLAAGMALLAVATSPTVAVLAMVLAGVGLTVALTSLMTMLQERAPDELRGRVMALWSVAFLGSRPVAAAMNGAIADAVSVRAALAVVVVLVLVGAYWGRPAKVDPRAAPGADGFPSPAGEVR